MTKTDAAAEALRARFRREEAELHAAGYLTVADAMELLGVARFTVNRMIGDGCLHAVRYESLRTPLGDEAGVDQRRACGARHHRPGSERAHQPWDAGGGPGRCGSAGSGRVADSGRGRSAPRGVGVGVQSHQKFQ
ncbi:helix-turn-helix domain-containing protein [Mycolicibacterium goodii]|uniref:helix-turn-helix domain-containing protein n=1 Tax=Mycolicibacterium goodii TaxID=134601 RepID=UPI001BDBBA31|nr:helix-turn-helix domain-containing protein [Mycolicibacterium goodii]MBU8815078.1 helix-turn-helix domain-containing protein [Mycolicibacterium goodii]